MEVSGRTTADIAAATADDRDLRARWIFDEMSRVCCVLAPDGRLLEANRAALRHGGYTREELRCRPVWTADRWFPTSADRRRVRRAVQAAAGGQPVRFQSWLPSPGSRSRTPFDLAFRPIADGHGATTLLLLEGTDLTELRKAEQEVTIQNRELRALAGRLREVDQLRQRFIADVSHDLKTPLAILLGLTQRMLEHAMLTPGVRRDVEGVRRNTFAMLAQVDDLLTSSSLEARHLTLRWQPDDLAVVVRGVASAFEPLAASRDLTLQIETPTRLPAVIDRRRMTTLISNLLSNALKFTPSGGSVRVSLRGPAARTRLEVADSGPGIPPHLRAAVFERYEQGAGLPPRSEHGAGIGLSIVCELAVLHGGRVRVQTAPEGGALFVVELALRPAPHTADPAERLDELAHPYVDRLVAELGAAVAPDADVAPADAANARPLLLLVEDDPKYAAAVAARLADGYMVVHADSFERAIASLAKRVPAVVVTDLALPGLSGFELLDALRSRTAMDGVPILLLSGSARAHVAASALRHGADDCIEKTVEPEELRARIDRAVALAGYARELRLTANAVLAAFDAAPHPLALLDANGEIVRAGASFCALVGRSAAELKALTIDALSHPEDVGAEGDLLALGVAGPTQRLQVERRLLRPDGREVPVRLSFAAVGTERDAEGAVVVQAEDLGPQRQEPPACAESGRRRAMSQPQPQRGEFATS